MSKLKEVTERICELLKGTELDPMVLKAGCVIEQDGDKGAVLNLTINRRSQPSYMCFNNDIYSTPFHVRTDLLFSIIGSPIRLDEVLMALKTLLLRPVLDGLAKLFHDNDGNKALLGLMSLWQLGKPLSDQSENTINFLHTILNQTP